ncbi:NAD(P)H-binding protein [Kribbella kalugense]|uniref:NAD(P)H dehydrogenase (Quinone) n=1 Tax=Kribbella kalugense TaxID=2512221 RepID=A0A4R7ZKG1_9ACTN|nr:NAD(P)H-binding protein [Kribbella kalugense]TDW18279.1 NAD(P)H dehydrogenase (quinone) [Kribbella kalugense]
MVFAITGGHGEFGSAVVSHLKTLTDQPVVATVREPSKAQPVPGVDYRPGDFDDPATLRASLAGVETILVNATFFGTDPSARRRRVTAAIGAAAEAGVRRIVLTSWPDLERATMPTVQDYRELEAAVRAAGPSWTIVRLAAGLPDALARDVAWGRKTGELVAPANGASVTPAALTDLAEASAAVVLSTDLDSAVVELTGPDAIGWDKLADLAGVPFRAVTDDEFVVYLTGTFGLPEAAAQQLTALYVDFRSRWSATPTTTLADLLSHPATPGADAVLRRVARFPS